MVQTVSRSFVDSKGGSFYEEYDTNETVALSVTLSTVLAIESFNIRNSVIQIYNEDGAISENYAIYATAKKNANQANLNTREWVNLTSIANGGVYNHNATKSIAAGVRAFESFVNPWAVVIVQMSSASGTPNATVYHRGQN